MKFSGIHKINILLQSYYTDSWTSWLMEEIVWRKIYCVYNYW